MTMKFIVAALASAALVHAATKIDMKTQSKNVDLGAAISVRPFRTGTALPLRCNAGEMFFKTDATPGANSYGCTAPDVWTVQGQIAAAGGATATDAPLAVTRSSDTSLSIGGGCSPTAVCNVRIGAGVYSFNSAATVTLVSGTGTVYVYVAGDGAIVVGAAAADSPAVQCTKCRAESPVSSFPLDSIPLAFWHATSGVWDPAGTDSRATLSAGRTFTAGANITITESGNNVTIAADSAAGSGTELQYHNGGKLAAVDSSSVTGGAVRLGGTVPADAALLTLGDALVQGNTAGTALGINTPAGFTGDLANWMNGGVSRLKVTAAGELMLGNAAVWTPSSLELVSDGSEALFMGNAAGTEGSSVRIAVAGADASNEIRIGGATEVSFVVNGVGKAAIGTAAASPAAPGGPDLLVQDNTAGTGNTQVVIAAGAGQNRPLTQWVGLSGIPGARISADGAVQNLPAGVQPVCDSSTRGMFWHTQAGSGVKDDVQVCAKDASDAYAWRVLF